MKIIRASDVSTYIYCQRAWWYRDQGIDPENLNELSLGIQLHEAHGRTVFINGCMRVLAYILLFLSVTMLSLYFVLQIINS